MAIRTGIQANSTGGSGPVPTLQQVTTAGNITSNDIISGTGTNVIKRFGNGTADTWKAGSPFSSLITHSREGYAFSGSQLWPEAGGVFQVSQNGLVLQGSLPFLFTGTYTIQRFDSLIACNTSGGNVTILLPINLPVGFITTVKIYNDGGTGNVVNIHTTPPGGPIDNNAAAVVTLRIVPASAGAGVLQSVTLQFDGVAWYILSSYGLNVPSKPYVLAISGLQSAALTGTLAETNLVAIPLPKNTLLPFGLLRISALFTFAGVAGTKTPFIKIDTVAGSTGGQVASNVGAGASSLSYRIVNLDIYVKSAGAAEVVFPTLAAGASTLANLNLTFDPTVNNFININGQLGNIADSFTLSGYIVEIINQ